MVDGDADRLESFLAAYDLFLLGLQAIDDVVDHEAGSRASGLRRADCAGLLARGAAADGARSWCSGRRRRRRAAGSPGSGAWLVAFARAIAPWSLGGDSWRTSWTRSASRVEIEEAMSRPRRAAASDAPPRPAQSPLERAISYDRELEWNEPPSACERRYTRWTVVRAAGAPAAAWWPLARIGSGRSPPRPAGKRSRGGGPVGDARDRRQARAAAAAGTTSASTARSDRRVRAATTDNAAAGAGPARAACADVRAGHAASDAIRVAIIDVVVRQHRGAGRHGRRWAVARGPARRRSRCHGVDRWRPAHGTMMAGVVLAGRRMRASACFRSPASRAPRARISRPADLAAAVATAVEGWRADVVLIAMSDGAWGTPGYLGDVLREAARLRARRPRRRDVLLGRRPVAQPRPPGRQRRPGRRRSGQPALGPGDRRLRRSRPLVPRTVRAGYAGGGRAARPTTASVRPSRWRRRASDAGGASTSQRTTPARRPPWRRPPPRACWPPTATCRRRSCERCWRSPPTSLPTSTTAAGWPQACSTTGIGWATASSSDTASSMRTRPAWAPRDPVCLALLATRTVPDAGTASGPAGRGFGLARACGRRWRARPGAPTATRRART